jgi:Protein of unknown function (DUF3304)
MATRLKTDSWRQYVRYSGGATRSLRAAGLAVGALLTLSACAGTILPDDPFDGPGSAMAMVPVNHTDRYAVNIFIDKYWAGDGGRQSGGGKAACCYPGLKDWSKPITVKWTWGTEEDPKTKAITMLREPRSVIANFPASGPHSDPDLKKDDAYVCVILRDLDTAELAFSPTRKGCFDK